MATVEFSEIHKTYGDFKALQGVSFEVRPGEVFGLLGPNGAGKTSLIRILMDIIRADSGTMRIFGEPHHRGLLDRIGYLPEERGLYKKAKVKEVMLYFGALKGLSKSEATRRSLDWLERIGMPDVFNNQIQTLSKGMTQKVQIASTLFTEPELVVLDEPFSGLDPVNAVLIRDLIDDRRNAGLTTILSTHQMNIVDELCDRVSLIHRGQRILYGNVQEIREKHSRPQIDVRSNGPLPRIELIKRYETLKDGQERLHLNEDLQPNTVLKALIQAGADIQEFRKVLAPMQDVFVQVVGPEALEEDKA